MRSAYDLLSTDAETGDLARAYCSSVKRRFRISLLFERLNDSGCFYARNLEAQGGLNFFTKNCFVCCIRYAANFFQVLLHYFTQCFV